MIPHHSLFYWALYLIWIGGFGLTAVWILRALRGAISDRDNAVASGRNGLLLIEARRAVRLETVRLAQAGLLAPLGVWAVFSPDPRMTLRGTITLMIFLLLGALVCSQTWFDAADRRKQMAVKL